MALHVAATPIGNLEDATPRLCRVLEQADLLLAEDTRTLRRLLSALAISAKAQLLSVHAHNEQQRIEPVMEVLARGGEVVLTTDAGTPNLSDPGAAIVASAHAEGYAVRSVAGPSAAAAALSVAGFSGHTWHFIGFPPRRTGPRKRLLRQALGWPGPFVLYEAPGRVERTLAQLAELAPEREACLCRELTKRFEEVLRAPLPHLAERAQRASWRGEITVVVGPGHRPRTAETATGTSTRPEAVLARRWGVPRREVYRALVEVRHRLRKASGTEE